MFCLLILIFSDIMCGGRVRINAFTKEEEEREEEEEEEDGRV